MGLPELVKGLIAGPVVNILGPFRATITHTPLTGQGAFGPTYGPPVDRLAVVEVTSELVASADGTQKLSTSKFTFMEPISIREGDRIKLKNVTTVVVKVAGVLDPQGIPYAPEAWTGEA